MWVPLTPLDVFRCLTNDLISLHPPSKWPFPKHYLTILHRVEKCFGTARREYICGCIYPPTSIFPCEDLVSCHGCITPPQPPLLKKWRMCVMKLREVNNERYYPSWGFSTQRSISLPLQQTDHLSSWGWRAKINLLTSSSPKYQVWLEKCKKYCLTLSLGEDQPSWTSPCYWPSHWAFRFYFFSDWFICILGRKVVVLVECPCGFRVCKRITRGVRYFI